VDRTKEENRELETLKKLSHMNGLLQAIYNLSLQDNINILEYDSCDTLYRVQVKINDRFKTVARLKISKKDIYILIRETTARAINKEYEIINYNLPAGFHETTATDTYNALKAICDYHIANQTA
jgi:hypothetical protein